MNIQDRDPAIASLLLAEEKRQKDTLMMIPSENYTSVAVREALGSVLTNKYAEGYPGKRYYQGNSVIDKIETLAIERAKALFSVPHVNVQAYSGSPANAAIFFGLLQHGDTVMGLKLSGGGHLTHGHPDVTFSGKYVRSVQFDVNHTGRIDMDAAARLAVKEKPQLIVVGTTAYPRMLDWAKWREIADSVDALLLADISHIAGLVIADEHPSPAPYADVIMTTTHKTLRGPRGAMIMVTERGLARDADMGNKIDKAVFPGLQGGPHNNVTAAIAVALEEAAQPEFVQYAKQIVLNARTLAEVLMEQGFKLTTGGTDNHLLVIDLQPLGIVGTIAAEALELAGIIVNRNSVPFDPNPPFYPSGVRLGTPGVTTRGMKEDEMRLIGSHIGTVIRSVAQYHLPEDKMERKVFMQTVRQELAKNTQLHAIAAEIKSLCDRFPLE